MTGGFEKCLSSSGRAAGLRDGREAADWCEGQDKRLKVGQTAGEGAAESEENEEKKGDCDIWKWW
jgi:hypothetical protein